MRIKRELLPAEGSDEFEDAKLAAVKEIAARFVVVGAYKAVIDCSSKESSMIAVSAAQFNELIAPMHCVQYVDDKGAKKVWTPVLARVLEYDAARRTGKLVDEDATGWELQIVDRLDALPGQDVVFVDPDDGSKCRNTWVRPKFDLGYAPEVDRVSLERECEWFFDFLRYLLNDDETAIGFVLKWIAHMIQRPDERCSNVVLLMGVPGNGKSTFGEIVGRLVGLDNYWPMANAQALTERFNGWVSGPILVHVHETYMKGNYALVDSVKSLVSDPKLAVERKGLDRQMARVFARFLLCSNDPNPVSFDLKVGEDGSVEKDRRWFCADTALVKRCSDYFNELQSSIRDDNKLFLLYQWFMTFENAEFRPFASPPETAAKRRLVCRSEHTVVGIIRDGLEDERLCDGARVASTSEVMAWLAKNGYSAFASNESAIASAFRLLKVGTCRPRADNTGGRPRKWNLQEYRDSLDQADSLAAAGHNARQFEDEMF
ncbi:primase-helicase family protein [Beijerinckia mobilis]|uniref:primase-helicase family protein n=1 Tax=Beijerinckia mobilis TaxID=231434 RepID=UPI000555FB57|nr:primase-helicase family protein [Beijerinckia mobilis]